MKKFLEKAKKFIIQHRIDLLVIVVMFGGLFAVTKLFLRDTYRFYWFDWTARHSYLYLWFVAFLLLLWEKQILSRAITFGNAVGVLLGQFAGDWIRAYKVSQITSDMPDWEVAQSYLHPGFQIWIITVFVFFVVGVVLTIFIDKKRKSNKSPSCKTRKNREPPKQTLR